MTDRTNQCRPGFMVSPQFAQIPVALVFYKTNCLQRMDGKQDQLQKLNLQIGNNYYVIRAVMIGKLSALGGVQ